MNKKLINLIATAALVPAIGFATGTCPNCYTYDSSKEILIAPTTTYKDKLASSSSKEIATPSYDQVKEILVKKFGSSKPTVNSIFVINNQKMKVMSVEGNTVKFLPCTGQRGGSC